MRSYGYSTGGIHLHVDVAASKGQNISVVAAISERVFIGAQIYDGSCNAERFIEFLNSVLPHCRGMCSYVIMDNASIHRAA
jgi:hypothetical protein